MTLTVEQQLVERLEPSYQADKAAIEAAVQLRDQYPKLTEALNASIVANNALKSEAVATLSTLKAQVAELTEALKPFADYMSDGMDCDNHGNPLPDNHGVGWIYLTYGDFRRARRALAEEGRP